MDKIIKKAGKKLIKKMKKKPMKYQKTGKYGQKYWMAIIKP
ncbi:MAG: hypothetical protein ABH827_02395 [bacterium]